jgi:hypothetical protein
MRFMRTTRAPEAAPITLADGLEAIDALANSAADAPPESDDMPHVGYDGSGRIWYVTEAAAYCYEEVQ